MRLLIHCQTTSGASLARLWCTLSLLSVDFEATSQRSRDHGSRNTVSGGAVLPIALGALLVYFAVIRLTWIFLNAKLPRWLP